MVGSISQHQGTTGGYFQSRFMPGTSLGELSGRLKGIQWPSTGQAFPASGLLVLQFTRASTFHEYASAARSCLQTPNTACVNGLGGLGKTKPNPEKTQS